MMGKMVQKDLLRNKTVTAALAVFILVPAFLLSGSAAMIYKVSGSLDSMFAQARVPHFVQMHSGFLNAADRAALEQWSYRQPLVRGFQAAEMLTLDGSDVYLGDGGGSESASVMDLGFVKQNPSFDFLLDTENTPVQVRKGQIAIPLYHMQKRHLAAGDKVRIRHLSYVREFEVAGFVRDALMNPSIIHSKRFVVHEDDFEDLKANLGETEYLLEFLLSDPAKAGEFAGSYKEAGLPGNGPALGYEVLRVINVLTDGIVAVIVIFASLVFCSIAVLSLRFTILASLEEDYREIGVMKAIGFGRRNIRRMYLYKYLVLSSFAAGAGWIASLMLSGVFTSHITLYLGPAPESLAVLPVTLFSAFLVWLIVASSCMLTLRGFDKISAVQALRLGVTGDSHGSRGYFPLRGAAYRAANVFLGLRDVFLKAKSYLLLFIIFAVSTFVIIVPVNFLNTIQSPSFITYLGIGRSDLRIDLRQSENMAGRFADMVRHVESDKDVTAYSALITHQCRIKDGDGDVRTINVETGDFASFPLEYLEGTFPGGDREIALSYLNAKELQKKTGDRIFLLTRSGPAEVTVCGIYQDVTSGGLTAKTSLPLDPETALWYVVNLNVSSDVDKKLSEYSRIFYPARVTDSRRYVSETLGDEIKRLRDFTFFSTAAAILVSMLITALFLRMMIAKDSSQIAILKCIGFSLSDIRLQYIVKALFVLNAGIAAGTLASNTLGQEFVSMLWGVLGASRIRFVVDPLQAYFVFPLSLMVMVSLTTLICTLPLRSCSVAQMNAE